MKKYLAEYFGTFVLVFFGCGAAVVSGTMGIGIFGIACAFGLSIMAMCYVIGGVSGCHINPAVSLAKFLDGQLSGRDFLFYVVAQILGAVTASLMLVLIIGHTDIVAAAPLNLGQNGYAEFSATNISLLGAAITEIILTFIFVLVVLCITHKEEDSRIAGLIIGVALILVHIVGIPLTGTSVNPARSFAPALIVGGEAIKQVWVFVVAPLVGSCVATMAYRGIYANQKSFLPKKAKAVKK